MSKRRSVWVYAASAALPPTEWAALDATGLRPLCSEAGTHPFPQSVRIPTLSLHPAVDPMPDFPEFPSAEEQKRKRRQEEENRSQDEPQDDQNQAQDEADERLERTQDAHDDSNVRGLPPTTSRSVTFMAPLLSGAL